MQNYNLKKEYVSRLENHYFDDTPYKDEYQNEVYEEAKNISNKNKYSNIIDIGTGSGYKLIKYFDQQNTIGVDLEPTITFLKNKYPNKKWSSLESVDKNFEYDLIICSDAIEHIPEPTSFINEINKIKFKKIVFSTPDKLSMYGGEHFGPPSNPSHVREWDMNEIYNYLSNFYIVEKHFKIDPNSNTQIIVCSKK